MAGADPGRLSGAALERWFRRTPGEIEDERRRAEAAGREAWAKATKTGQQVLARTRSELEALGHSELARQASAVARRGAEIASDPNSWREARAQVDAVGRAAANRMTFGRADRFAAFADAGLGMGAGDHVADRYQSNLRQQRALTNYDAEHRGVAKAVGDFAGEALAAKGLGMAGAGVAGRLPPKAKGVVGELLSAGKTLLQGDTPVAFQKRHPLATGGYTVLDHRTARGKYVEAKFGPTARLSPRQRQAQALYGDGYRVDRWQPDHVGRIAGGAGAGATASYDYDDYEP